VRRPPSADGGHGSYFACFLQEQFGGHWHVPPLSQLQLGCPQALQFMA
jgi:hypothetical protein